MGRFKTLWREGNFYLLADIDVYGTEKTERGSIL